MRRPSPPRPSSLAALLLALGALLGLTGCGDDGPTPASGPASAATAPTSEAAAPHPIRFTRGLAAGVEAAGDPDALLFVYVARHRPT